MEFPQIQERLIHLRDSPSISISPKIIESGVQAYHQRFPKSLAMFQEIKEVIPGGCEHMNSVQWPYPLIMNKAKGAYLYDIDGNPFIDYLMTSGPCILGHNYPDLSEYVINVIRENGPATGVMCEYELLAAKEIVKHYPTVDQIRFYQSGSEANMAMTRIARLFTNKQKIIKIGGSYHGWTPEFTYDMHIPGTGPMFAHGIPEDYYKHTLSAFPNDIDGLEHLLKTHEAPGKGGVAAIVLEAIGGDSGTFPPSPDYNKQVRELCDKYNTLLVYDEVVTGFRLAMGGAQEYYNVKADISVFGKIVGHEYPSAGAVGASKEIMQMITGKPGEANSDLAKKVFTAGTMAGTNITCAAAYKAIKCIEETNAIEIAATVADRLVEGLNAIFEKYQLPFFAYNFKSIIQLRLSGFYTQDLSKPDALQQITLRRTNLAQYVLLLMLEGINTLQGIRMYTSLMHKDEELIQKTLQGFENFCKKVSQK